MKALILFLLSVRLIVALQSQDAIIAEPEDVQNSTTVSFLPFHLLLYIFFFQIRQCTCSESDACVLEAYSQFLTCRLSCQSKLEYFGNETEKYITACFPTPNPSGAEMVNTCLKKYNVGFCASSDVDSTIPQTHYYPDFPFISEHDAPIVKDLKTFHACSGACLKEHILACYQRKACGVFLPPTHDLGKVGLFCPELKSTVTSSTIKAVPCFYYQNSLAKMSKN